MESVPAPLEPYPPQVDAWRFPPPPVSRRWVWAAVIGSVVALAAIVAMVVGIAVVATTDLEASLDDPEIIDAVDAGCEEIESIADLVEIDSLDVDRPSRITLQNEVLQQVVDTWTGLDADLRASDVPFDEWVADWQRLIDARVDYLADFERNPRTLFIEPRVDGKRLSERMDAVNSGCQVPESLLAPDEGIAERT